MLIQYLAVAPFSVFAAIKRDQVPYSLEELLLPQAYRVSFHCFLLQVYHILYCDLVGVFYLQEGAAGLMFLVLSTARKGYMGIYRLAVGGR